MPSDFATTRWSLVLAAGHKSRPASAQALAALCQTYWYPLYAYVRRRVGNLTEAQDLTQEFFARLLEKNFVAGAQPDRGRFRSFLLTCLKNFLTNESAKARAKKRGGEHKVLVFDFAEADSKLSHEPSHQATPEKIFQRHWTLRLLEQVLGQLRVEHEKAGKKGLFEALKSCLTGEQAEALAEVGRRLGMTEGAVKVAAHRLRKRYRELLREEVAQTVADPNEVDEEIRELFASLDL